MNKVNAEQRIRELRQQIAYHNRRYYTLDDPEVSDAHYDRLMQQLAALEEQFPGSWPNSTSESESCSA